METPSLTFLSRLLLGVFLVAGGSRVAQAADWQSLTGNSPFGAGATTAPVAAADELEFRGVVQEEGIYFINLFNPTTKTSQWLPVKGQASGLEVQSYDATSDKVQVMRAGRPLTLSLKQARVTLVQPASPPALPTNPNGPMPENQPDGNRGDRAGEGPRPGKGGDPSTMVRNLPPEAQAMIQEFRRRRAERAAQRPVPLQRQP